MAQYYVIRVVHPTGYGEGFIEIEDWDDIEGFDDWGVGRLAKKSPQGPVQIKAVPRDGFKGDPVDFQDQTVPLMSKRLKEVLDSAGVDNINYLPITLRHTETGQIYDYFAFNLLGLVAAADLAQSDISSFDGDFVGDSQVHGLVIDPSKPGGALIFRLKEKFTAILVHEKIKQAVESAGIKTITFIKPENYMAL
jgi:hypothetical protein